MYTATPAFVVHTITVIRVAATILLVLYFRPATGRWISRSRHYAIGLISRLRLSRTAAFLNTGYDSTVGSPHDRFVERMYSGRLRTVGGSLPPRAACCVLRVTSHVLYTRHNPMRIDLLLFLPLPVRDFPSTLIDSFCYLVYLPRDFTDSFTFLSGPDLRSIFVLRSPR